MIEKIFDHQDTDDVNEYDILDYYSYHNQINDI
jgi:hypothetical protein